MIKCTKQWTDVERQILARAAATLSDSDEYLCNNILKATSHTHNQYAHPACDPILDYIKRLLGTHAGVPYTYAGWLSDIGIDLPFDREECFSCDTVNERNALRREWVRWMLGEIEADGTKFPIYATFQEHRNHG